MATTEEKTVGRPQWPKKKGQQDLTPEEQGFADAMRETARQGRESPGPDPVPFPGTDEEVSAALAEVKAQAAREIKEQMLKDAELAKTGEWTVRDLARQLDIPPGFVMTINGKPYITKEGLLQQARRIGFDAIEATVKPLDADDPSKGFEAEAKVWRSFRKDDYALLEKMVGIGREEFWKVYQDLRRPTVAHGSANPDNVKMGAMKAYLRELAETRAINRALRLFTGCGLVSIDELADVGHHGIVVKDAAAET